VNLHSVVAPDRLFSFNNGRNKHDISAQLDRVCSTSTQFQRQTVHINVLSVTHIKDEKKYMMQNNNLLQKKQNKTKTKTLVFECRYQFQIAVIAINPPSITYELSPKVLKELSSSILLLLAEANGVELRFDIATGVEESGGYFRFDRLSSKCTSVSTTLREKL